MNSIVNRVKKIMKRIGHVEITWLCLFLFIALMRTQVQAETYEYDDLNRVTKVIYEDNSYMLYEYDANGNITSQTYHESDYKMPDDGNAGDNKPEKETITDGKTTETPKMEKPADKHKKGMKAKSKHATYVITSVKKKTASFYKLNNKKKKSYTVPNTVKIDGVTYKVTKIAAKAFKNHKKIKTITIGKNITSIGKQAFSGCKKLKAIKVPKKYYKKYKKMLKGKGQKKNVKIKKR